MKSPCLFIFIVCMGPLCIAFGQTNFREAFEDSNPVAPTSTLSIDQRIKLDQAFLDSALESGDKLKQVYGYLYLFYEQLRLSDYPEATRYLLKAEEIANASGDPGWQGWVAHRRGILMSTLDRVGEAISVYTVAAKLCGEAGDSLCLGESLEQIGSQYAKLDSFETSQKYFDQALPIMRRHQTEQQFGNTTNNYAIFLSRQGRAAEAIPLFEQSIAINLKNKKYREAGKGMNNLADAYRRLGKPDFAIEKWIACITFNKEHGLRENLISNYLGLYTTYYEQDNYKPAIDYYIKHIELLDSLKGVETQQKIAALESRFDSEHNELLLQKSRMEMEGTQRYLNLLATLLFFGLLLIATGLWYWQKQTARAARELEENQENLNRVTRILLEKNTLLANLEAQLSVANSTSYSPPEVDTTIDNLYNQRILTEADWAAFKVYFEKTYPGYLLRLRNSCPTLSESEERLCLFIKLKLTRKEAAAILGISADSVKKTRNRLRKRLGLEREDSLEEFIDEI